MSLDQTTWAALFPALSGLLGVIAGGVLQFFLAERTAARARREHKEDLRLEEGKAAAQRAADRGLPALKVARHLESYTLRCAETFSHNARDSGYDGYLGFPDWHPWPEGITWELLGAIDSARAQDFETNASLHEKWLSGNIEFGASDERDAAEYAAQSAGRAGLEAWIIAESIRANAGLPALTFGEHVWDYPETLREAKKTEERKVQEAIARRSRAEDDL